MTGEQDPRRWIALGVLCLSVLLISLDQTILNVALPTLIGDLHPGTGSLPWIADGYTLTNGVLILFAAALGDRYGRRRIFLLGAGIFGAGSLACALSHDTDAVIAARTIMGLGAAFLIPATLSIITATFSGGERAKAIGLWAGVGGIGAAAGPLLGGFLLQHFWWGSDFLINVPVAAITVVAGILVIEESRAPRRPRLDLPGVALSATGLGAITYGLITGPDDGWGSARVAGSLAGGALAASFAPRHSLRAVMVAGMAAGTGGLAVLALVPPGSGITSSSAGPSASPSSAASRPHAIAARFTTPFTQRSRPCRPRHVVLSPTR